MYIHQHLLDVLEGSIEPSKVLIIYGPRRTGKTTLLNKFLEGRSGYLLVNGEDRDTQHYLSSQSIAQLKAFVGSHHLLVIDEAQKIPDVGLNLKLLVDHCPELSILATGSSAFDLAHQLGEPLTGRKITLRMFPLSQMEIGATETIVQTRAHLEARLIYGSYPEVVVMQDQQKMRMYLHELVNAYLYKDILAIEGIRKSKQITQLLQLLAFQMGKEVSLSELGQQVGLNRSTVERYLDLLEKAFVLVNIPAFDRNLRKTISKKSRYYFYDVGVRNAIINHFHPLSMRNDVGELWENYLVIERIKKQNYQNILSNNYFWRSYNQQEIDWIEERDGALFAFEMKWKQVTVKVPSEWRSAYPGAEFKVIHQENYLDFIT